MIVLTALIGLTFGSFVNALVWRLREQELAAESREHTGSKKRGKKGKTTSGKHAPAAKHAPVTKRAPAAKHGRAAKPAKRKRR